VLPVIVMVHEIPPRSDVTSPPAVLPVPSTESETRELEARAPRSSGSTLFRSEPQEKSTRASAEAVSGAESRTKRPTWIKRIGLEVWGRHRYECQAIVSMSEYVSLSG
jgi:hypothetical protein